ncbi:TolC family protein [Clostridium ganghwense]|uniref:TolC family protein n=1 Tax=Clostridium ganghwense TaxID=312089 RepID=A0ABT4CSM7_9CLOT|nr:TolC family protein [Clostridium ganghwense]MCY6370979.1 TolC family protein [Clostridium ganghwense]
MKKKSIFKMLSLGFASIFVGGAVLSVSAAPSKGVLSLTKEQAVQLSIKNSNNMKRLDTGMDTLDRKFKKYKKLSQEAEEAMDGFEDYKDAYKKINSDEFKEQSKKLVDAVEGYNEAEKTLKELQEKLASLPEGTPEEVIAQIKAGIAQAQGVMKYIENEIKPATIDDMREKYAEMETQLAEFNAAKAKLIATGLADKDTGKPKNLTAKEEYNFFIMPKDIGWYTVQCMIEKTVKKKEVANVMADVMIKEAYDNLLYAQEGYKLKKQLYDRMLKGYNDLVKTCEVGQASELQKNLTKIELDKTKLELDKLSRDIENGEIQFKNALGVNLSREIQLIDTLNMDVKAPLSYEKYLSSALGTRSEIFDADVDLKEKKRTMDILKDYFDDEDYEYMNAQKALDEAQLALDEAKKDVEENMQNAYLNVIHKKGQIDLASKNLEKAKQQLDSALKAYKLGTKPVSLTWDAELGLNKAKMDYNTAVRNYNIALYKLEKASKIGPAY